jgi:uncharacterized membrane protein YvbJ
VIRCQACGTENNSETTYCSKCARKLDPQTQEKVARQRAEHTVTGIRWETVLLTTVVIIVIVVLVAVFVVHV